MITNTIGATVYSKNTPGIAGILGATFDGTNDYLSYASDYTGLVDGKVGIVALRIRMNGGDGVAQTVLSTRLDRLIIERSASNKISAVGKNSAGSFILIGSSTIDIIVDGYYDILMSWDMAGVFQCYVDDAPSTTSIVHTDDTIEYATGAHKVGTDNLGVGRLNADVSFVYQNLSEYLDFSVEANRRKFFTSSGAVVDMGSDGSTPTGTPPDLFLRGDYTTFESNKSGNGGLTVTGALSRPAS